MKNFQIATIVEPGTLVTQAKQNERQARSIELHQEQYELQEQSSS